MFISSKLIFLELQKTGGTHIRKLLERYTDGHVVRKHNRVPSPLPDRFVFGSVRNPWDWYVSLWAYGVGGKGAIRGRTTRGIDHLYYRKLLPRSMGKTFPTPMEYIQSYLHDRNKPVTSWLAAYENADDFNCFRNWLGMLLDHHRRFDIGEGFAFCPASQHAGLMTYRYLRQFTTGLDVYRDQRLSDYQGLREFDNERNISDGMIRNEELEKDLVDILIRSGHELTDAEQAEILNKEGGKTNISKRNPVSYYYDKASIELVASRERFIIDKYNYQSPGI